MLSSCTWILILTSCIWQNRCSWSLASDLPSRLYCCGRMFSRLVHLKTSIARQASGFHCSSCCTRAALYLVQFHMNSVQQRHLMVRLQCMIEEKDMTLTYINSRDSQISHHIVSSLFSWIIWLENKTCTSLTINTAMSA